MFRCPLNRGNSTLPATIKGAEPVTVSAVHVRECAPPEGEQAIEWFLLTSLDIDHFDRAVELIGYYLRRWRVEDFFRVLKSGCRAEYLAFRTAERLQRAITIQAVIAWRLMLMTLLGREVPECDAELLFSDVELRFLNDYAAQSALPAPSNLSGAVLLVAILGGYQNRKHDPPPGQQLLWRGYERPPSPPSATASPSDDRKQKVLSSTNSGDRAGPAGPCLTMRCRDDIAWRTPARQGRHPCGYVRFDRRGIAPPGCATRPGASVRAPGGPLPGTAPGTTGGT